MIGTLPAALSTAVAAWTYDDRRPRGGSVQESGGGADVRRTRSVGGAGRNREERIRMKAKLYNMGVTAAMFVVLVESLGAGRKWG
jgi:hypothetical protein